MQILPMHTKYLDVFQICDSTFPIGTFNHSYGMESYLRDNRIDNSPTFEAWLNAFLKTQYTYGEGLLCKLVFEALKKNQQDDIWKYDRLITVSTTSKETREAAKLVSFRMIELLLALEDDSLLRIYQEKINSGEVFGNPAIVYTIAMREKDLSVDEMIVFYGYSLVSTMVQNAVRAVPLGQIDGQLIVKRSFDTLNNIAEIISSLDDSTLGANSPGIELSQVQHETQVFRLFMS